MVGILRQSAGPVTLHMLKLRPLPAFTDNYIWTLSAADGRAIVVDPGDAAPVLEAVASGLMPIAILLTHHHPDHIGGAGELLERFDIPCYAPVDERIQHATHRVREGDRVRIDALDIEFSVCEIPGHTLTHIAFHGGGWLFCGDTLFSLGCGRMFEGSPAQMLNSLEKLASLPGETLVCCGHEYTEANGRFSAVAEPQNPARDTRRAEVAMLRERGEPSLPSTLASERACNPFLRVDQPGVLDTLRGRSADTSDRIAAFAALRAWKDGFAG
jgi:hydroxyacylglutathione hydrolase